jgi:hypothetical protein
MWARVGPGGPTYFGSSWCHEKAKPLNPTPAQSHKKAVTWIETSPDGKEMITASAGEAPCGYNGNAAADEADGTIKVWQK